MKNLIAGAVLAVSLIVACAVIAQTPAQNADKAAIRMLEDDYTEAWTKRDAQRIAQSFTNDTDVMIILRILNRDGITNFYSKDTPRDSRRKAYQEYLEKLLGNQTFRFARRRLNDATIEFIGPGAAQVATSYAIDGARSGHPLWAGHTLRKVEKRNNQWQMTSFEEMMFSVPGS
jgi:ketosteroid isomerase-like protein